MYSHDDPCAYIKTSWRNDFHRCISPSIWCTAISSVSITSSQSESVLKSCLHNVVSVLPKHAFGEKGPERGPSIFLTDDDIAQRNALNAMWPTSVLFLCIFHFLQATWRWLLDQGNNSINKDDRRYLMSIMQELVFADKREEFEDKESQLNSDNIVMKYKNCHEYVKRALARKVEWAHCFRKGLITRGNNPDNFTESMIFMFKCVILKRVRDYNLVELVKLIKEDLEMYFQRNFFFFYTFNQQQFHGGSRE